MSAITLLYLVKSLFTGPFGRITRIVHLEPLLPLRPVSHDTLLIHVITRPLDKLSALPIHHSKDELERGRCKVIRKSM